MIDANAIESDWKSRGFSFGIWEDPPGQIWENYIHQTDELWMLAKGEVTLIIDGKILHSVIGEEILIPAGIKHTVKTSMQTGSAWFYGYKIQLNKI